MRVAWTGHRPELFAEPERARGLVRQETVRLRQEHGPELVMLSGGQRGVDLWAAAAAREHGLGLRVLLPAPAALLAAGWPGDDAAELRAALDYAAEVLVYGQSATDRAGFDARNRALAGECDLLIAVWTGLEQGGTFFTISEARACGMPIREHRLEPSGCRPAPGERGV